MNLKVPTFPLSMPIHVPIGGLLMTSMTSPLCSKRWEELDQEPAQIDKVRSEKHPYLQFEGICVIGARDEVGVN